MSKRDVLFKKGSKFLAFMLGAILFTCVFLAVQTHATSDTEAYAATENETTTTQVMYRLYNKWTGEHYYTADKTDKDNNVKLGWTDEGTGWIAPTKSDTPVYRLYNPYVVGGDHHYTTDEKE